MFMRSFSHSNLYLVEYRQELGMKSLIPTTSKLEGTGSSVKYPLLYPFCFFFLNDATCSKASKQEGTNAQVNTDSTDTVLHLSACKAESYELHFL